MEGLFLHRGAQEVSKADLDLIPLPEATESYTPVSHFHLSDRLLTISRDILTDYVLIGEKYALSRQGSQLFAYLQFRNAESDMGLAIGFRNSYDRSMSVGLAVGASVFVCDNLALTGDIAIMRKHTKNIWTTLEDLAISTIYKSQKNFQQIVADSEKMRIHSLEDVEAYALMGIMFGKDIISPRQLSVALSDWQRPYHEAFKGRNLWSLYNCFTEALKSSPPISIMENHIRLHNEIGRIIEV